MPSPCFWFSQVEVAREKRRTSPRYLFISPTRLYIIWPLYYKLAHFLRMGCVKITTCIVIAMLVGIAILPGLPPDLEFSSFNTSEPMDFVGLMAPNGLLNGAEKLFEGELDAPEGLAVFNGELYTGSRQGDVLKLVNGKLIKIVNIGHECAGYWEARKCGRVVGINFDSKGYLYATDAFYGIYKVDVKSGNFKHIIKTDVPIAGKIVRVANSVVVSSDGMVYWTSSICTNPDVDVEDALVALFSDANGRLFKYDPVKKTNTMLVDKIHFANGLALSENEDFVVVSETMRCRLLRYWLKGPNKGKVEVFLDNLPGIPDNMRLSTDGIFEVSLAMPRTKSEPMLSDRLSHYPLVRRFITRLIHYIELPFAKIHEIYPNFYTGILTHVIGNFDFLQAIMPQGLNLVRVDKNGKIVGSLQSTDKKVTAISDMLYLDGYYYLGSAHNKYLGRVKRK